jgi:LuxR family transcriptional regulator, maltose regulon positive regulatory protein
MDSSLLATKIQIPPKAAQVVHRSRLIDSLEAELPRCKLVLVAAPAGYGKTTLLSQWAHTSQLPVAWLSLSEEENELERFLRYLYHAWEVAQPGIRESNLGMMLEGRLADTQAFLSALVRLVLDTPGQTVFVLDDYHLVGDPQIHSAVTFLLDHLPPTAHIILSTRADPPLPLPRYRAHAELLELRTGDLMFWQEETQEFFKQRGG